MKQPQQTAPSAVPDATGADPAERELLQSVVDTARAIFGAEASSIFLLDEEAGDVVEKGRLDIAVDIPFPPMAMYDETNREIGFDPELARLIGQKLDIDVSINKQAFDSVIPSLQAGKNDLIMSGMNDTPERQETLRLMEREAVLLQMALYLDVVDADPSDKAAVASVADVIELFEEPRIAGPLRRLRQFIVPVFSEATDPVTVAAHALDVGCIVDVPGLFA
jgi:GAF domain-containing protein